MNKTIKIMGQTYEIKFIEPDYFRDKWGEIKYNDSEINIANDLIGHTKTRVILHELMHGIMQHCGFEYIEKAELNEEYLAEIFARGLASIISDNPNFMDIIGIGAPENKQTIKDS